MTIKVAGRGPEVLGVYAATAALTTIAIALRVYTRLFLVKKFGLDDWLAVLAWAVYIPFCAFGIGGTFHGTGQHAWDIQPPSELPVALKFWWLCEPVYVLANMAMKASIAVQLLRLTVIRTHRVIIWTTLIITELYSAFFFFLFVFQCMPSKYFWTQYTGGKGKCIDPIITVRATYGYSAIACLSDWTFATLPFFLVWKLQMTKKQKVMVALILAMGAIASTATIIRIPYIHTLTNMADFLYATTDVAIWSGVETALGITAMCMATLRPLFRGWLANRTFTGNGSRPTGHNSQPMPWAGSRGKSHGYIRSTSNSNGGRPFSPNHEDEAETLGMKGIKKTTRVSIDAYGPWIPDLEQGKEEDRTSSNSVNSETRIHKSHIADLMRR